MLSEHDFTFRGHKATVVIEVEFRNSVLRVPVGDLAKVKMEPHHGIGELRLAIGPPLMERLAVAEREIRLWGGPSV